MEKSDSTYFIKLISVLGAGVIGFGLGVYFAPSFQTYALWIVILGVIMHGYAMIKHQ